MSWISSTVAVELIKAVKEWLTNRNKATRQLAKVVSIYDAMHRVVNNTPIKRALVLKAHNGGGVIKPGSELFTSVLYEDYRVPFQSVKAMYQQIPLDPIYIKLLLDCYANRVVKMRPDTMKEGILKRIYTKEGVEHAEVHYLGQDKCFFYYALFSTENKDRDLNNAFDRFEIEFAVNQIKSLLK